MHGETAAIALTWTSRCSKISFGKCNWKSTDMPTLCQ